jgi:hypothetical protein
VRNSRNGAGASPCEPLVVWLETNDVAYNVRSTRPISRAGVTKNKDLTDRNRRNSRLLGLLINNNNEDVGRGLSSSLICPLPQLCQRSSALWPYSPMAWAHQPRLARFLIQPRSASFRSFTWTNQVPHHGPHITNTTVSPVSLNHVTILPEAHSSAGACFIRHFSAGLMSRWMTDPRGHQAYPVAIIFILPTCRR